MPHEFGTPNQKAMTVDVLFIDPAKPEEELIRRAAGFALQGATLVFPTDTVYGVGVAVLPGGSPKDIYTIKERDPHKAVPWLVAGTEDLETYGKDVPDYARELASRFWPGALTLVIKASKSVPPAFKADDGSIALRAPKSPIALALIRELGLPIATSSANAQGKKPAVSLQDLDHELFLRIGCAIDGGACPTKTASTIVSCLGERPYIVREGALTAEDLHLLH